MNQYIIDTNALISFVTDRDPAQQERIAALFSDAAELRSRILCPQNVLTEFVYVMEKVYQIDPAEIKNMVKDFIDLPGITIVHDVNLRMLLSYWPEDFADYGDAIVASVCRDHKGSSVATFDRKFKAKLEERGLSTIALNRSASIKK